MRAENLSKLWAGAWAVLKPSSRWQRMAVAIPADQFKVDPNWFVALLREP